MLDLVERVDKLNNGGCGRVVCFGVDKFAPNGGVVSAPTPTTPATYGLVFTDVLVDEIAIQGKSFKWIRPNYSCGCRKVWGHGYVARFFAAFAEALLLKRYRCPECRRVFTLMPAGFCRRYQTAGAEMAAALAARLEHKGWPRGIPPPACWALAQEISYALPNGPCRR